MKALLIATAAAALFAGNAQAGWKAGPMQQTADGIVGTPVEIVCNGAGSAYEGWSYIVGAEVWLGEYACDDAEAGRGPGMLVLLHELGHATGIKDERAATCFALHHIRPVLRHYYGFSTRQIRIEYRAALIFMHELDRSYWCAG